MTAPQVKRTDPPLVADERTMLTGWLDYHPSTLSLLGLVRHLTDVERSWFRRRVAGEQGPDVGPIYYSEERVDGDFDDLDDTDPARVYLHMIEEYARHNGHADLLRERIDGVTGE